jgi:hypothetical protein
MEKMTLDVCKTEFWPVARALHLRTEYEENVRNLNVPRNRRQLTKDTAEWFIQKAKVSNRPSQLLDEMTKYCKEYVNIYYRKN